MALRDGLVGSESLWGLETRESLARPGLDWRGRKAGSDMRSMTFWVRSRAAAAARERMPAGVLVLPERGMDAADDDEAWCVRRADVSAERSAEALDAASESDGCKPCCVGRYFDGLMWCCVVCSVEVGRLSTSAVFDKAAI